MLQIKSRQKVTLNGSTNFAQLDYQILIVPSSTSFSDSQNVKSFDLVIPRRLIIQPFLPALSQHPSSFTKNVFNFQVSPSAIRIDRTVEMKVFELIHSKYIPIDE